VEAGLIKRIREANQLAQHGDVTLVHHHEGEDEGVHQGSHDGGLAGHEDAAGTRGQSQQNTGGEQEEQ